MPWGGGDRAAGSPATTAAACLPTRRCSATAAGIAVYAAGLASCCLYMLAVLFGRAAAMWWCTADRNKCHASARRRPPTCSRRCSNLCAPTCLLLWLQYQVGDTVTLWVNKVGPYNNPQETCEWTASRRAVGRRGVGGGCAAWLVLRADGLQSMQLLE